MKKLILYIVSAILLFLLPFCNSEEEEKFFYFDFDPDLVVQSNDSLYFDLDRDGEDDLGAYVGKFESKINRQFPRFIALNSNTFIDWGGMASAMLLPIEFNHNVSEKSFWKTDSHYNLSLLSREKEAYIALKLVKDTNSYFGWMRFWFKTDDKLYIDNYAYNKTANESILAGKLQAGY